MKLGDKYRKNLIQKTAMLTAIIACTGALIMFVSGQQAPQMSIIAGLVCLIMLFAFGFTHFSPHHNANGLIVVVCCMLGVFIPILFSGGVHSRFTVMLPILPMIMALILRKRQTFVLMGVLIVYILLLNVVTTFLPDFTSSQLSDDQVFAKTFWLFMASVLSFLFGLIFVDINSKLTIQLESQHQSSLPNGLYDEKSVIHYATKILLKLATNKSQKQLVSLILIEPYAILDGLPSYSKAISLQNLAKLIRKNIQQDTDIIGHIDHKQLLVCIQTSDAKKSYKLSRKLLGAIEPKLVCEDSAIEVVSANIGIISADASVQVDANSLVSLAQLALKYAKQSETTNIFDYKDIRKKKIKQKA